METQWKGCRHADSASRATHLIFSVVGVVPVVHVASLQDKESPVPDAVSKEKLEHCLEEEIKCSRFMVQSFVWRHQQIMCVDSVELCLLGLVFSSKQLYPS